MMKFGRRSFLKGAGAAGMAGVTSLAAMSAMIRTASGAVGSGQDDAGPEKGKLANEDVWRLRGNYFESCNCDLVCPCIFLRPPTQGYCEAFVGWHVDEGHMGDVRLDGLNIAAWLHSPGMLTDGGWRLALYLDDRADEAQTAALTRIFGGEVGGHPAVLASLVGELLGVKSVPIEFKEENDEHFLQIPGIGRNFTQALAGEDGGKVMVSNHPLAVSPSHPLEVGYSRNAFYKDYGMEWRQDNRVGLAAPFDYVHSAA